jgi:stage III sporulation protein AA
LARIVTPALAELSPYLPPRLSAALSEIDPRVWARVEEIRLRAGRPVILGLADGEAWVASAGGVCAGDVFAGSVRTGESREPFVLSAQEAELTLELATRGSVYAMQEQLAAGYLTLQGGHRLGIAGKAVVDSGQLRGLRHPNSFCLRLARDVYGAADAVLPYLLEGTGQRIASTLFVSPPRCGKTTVLRDAARQLSNGSPRHGIPPQRVTVVDERSELAGCWGSLPTRDVGLRTDVLDSCPKAAGMVLALRSLSPDVLATDEIGRGEDVAAIEEAANCGVAVLATAHAWDLADLRRRPTMSDLLARGDFTRLVFLCRKPAPGAVAAVLDGRTLQPAKPAPFRTSGGEVAQ